MTPKQLDAAARRLGLTREELAVSLGVARRTVQAWLAGENPPHMAALALKWLEAKAASQ